MLNAFFNLPIRNKILTINGLTIMFLLLVGTISVLGMNQLQERAKYTHANFVLSEQSVSKMLAALQVSRIKAYKLVYTADPKMKEKTIKELGEYMDTYKEEKANYEKAESSDQEKELYQDYISAVNEYLAGVNQAIEFSQNGQAEEAVQLITKKNAKQMDKVRKTIKTLSEYQTLMMEKRLQESDNVFQTIMVTTISLSILAIISSAFLSLWFSSKISRTLNEISSVCKSMSEGNLAVDTNILEWKDELGQLSQGQALMVQNLRELISNIKHNADNMTSSSQELSFTSGKMKNVAEKMSSVSNETSVITDDLDTNIKTVASAIEQSTTNIRQVFSASEHVEQNVQSVDKAVGQVSVNLQTIAAATEEMSTSVTTVASAMEEMSSSLNEVSQNASKAATVAGKAERTAESTRQSIRLLGESAQQIGNVVELINGIASQTNLLALNATIEAASAGEAGKGFAVVANEVKQLAKQSAEATDEIRNRIEDMQANTQGVVEAISQITEIISEMSQINTVIASAVEEQTSTANEISHSIVSAAQASNEVSEHVQQAANLASEVSQQAKEATDGVVQITRNLQELNAGATEIASNAADATNRAEKMANSVEQVGHSSTETETGAKQVEQTAVQLSGLANQLTEMVNQFKLAS